MGSPATLMRYLVLTDIHANREALEACLDHARRSGIGRFIFMGDYVGYGADPAFAIDAIMREVEHGAVALAGNHDAAIAVGTAGMNPVASASRAAFFSGSFKRSVGPTLTRKSSTWFIIASCCAASKSSSFPKRSSAAGA